MRCFPHRQTGVSRHVGIQRRAWSFVLTVASISLALSSCGGGGGGGDPPAPPPSPVAGADLSGPWTVEITLQGTGSITALHSQGLLKVEGTGGSENATWRGSETLVFTDRREFHGSLASFMITNDGSWTSFTFTFPHYSIRCTYSGNVPAAPIDSLSGDAECAASAMQGTFSATRGMPSAEPMPDMVAVDAVDASTCALGIDGMAFCWGPNPLGGLGTGDTVPRIVANASNVGIAFKKVALSTGGLHACGLDVNGQAYCWGNREGGRMGDGMQGDPWTFYALAVAVAGGKTFTDIATGGDHVCAVAADGSAWCWGHNSAGQLGTGDFLDQLTPTKVSGNILFKSIAAHQLITCGIATNDAAWCWGNGSNGGLGNGTKAVTNVPVAVSGQHSFASLQLGLWSTCGVTTGGDGYCWGANLEGELGAGLMSDIELEPVLVAGGLKWKNISPGILYSCGVATSGVGYCWGSSYFGERGDGAFPAPSRAVPGPVTGDLVFQSIDADWHSCGVTVGGDIYCWGDGHVGSIGDGSLEDIGIPKLVTGS